MEKALNELLDRIGADYREWSEKSRAANNYTYDLDEKIEKFRNELVVEEGRKYIKIVSGTSVWGFVNKSNPKFEEGDLLKAANWRAPAVNRARGNIFGKFSIAWTGPHYLSGYSAGGKRDNGNDGLLRR